jgi:L-lysine exporter family protein LysE/ArgO
LLSGVFLVHWQAVLEGFFLSAGLIVAIGAQNAFVIRQGVTGRHVLAVAVTCTLCDILLISVGALGLGGLIASWPGVRLALVIVGLAFLGWYGVTSWMRAIRGGKNALLDPNRHEASTLGKIILLGLGFSLLNPQALLDTIVLIGGLASQYEQASARVAFSVGAAAVSVFWFFALAYGARLMQNLFRKPAVLRAFDGIVGTIMFWLMGSLAQSEFFS